MTLFARSLIKLPRGGGFIAEGLASDHPGTPLAQYFNNPLILLRCLRHALPHGKAGDQVVP